MLTEKVWIALIVLAGTILGACITTFGPVLVSKMGAMGKKKLLLTGNWQGEWRISFPDNKAELITDSMELNQNHNGLITGKGNVHGIGEYQISGKESHYCILLTFNGTETKEELAGVVLLKKHPGASTLTGNWVQLDHDGELIGGEVSFNKV